MSPAGDLADRFLLAAAENACGTHGPLAAADATATAVRLAHHHAAGRAVALAAADPALTGLDLAAQLAAARVRILRPDDPSWREELPRAGAGITGALAGVVETGSVALSTGPGLPRATSLLPPAHVCLVRTNDLVETFADALARVACGVLPSALTWIGGPSRTGDLEMVITLGVHGPRVVEVVLVASSA